MERRKHPRMQILVDLEMAVGRHAIGHGVASNVSSEGVLLEMKEQGDLPTADETVILIFKIWTGRERLCRAVNARVAHSDGNQVGLQFLDHDAVARAAVDDLLFYLSLDNRSATHAA